MISVILPLYNRRNLMKYTLECLKIEYEREESLEVIVVDDGSTDGGDIVVEKEYPWVKLFRQPNQGAPIARNKGLSESTGEYVLFLDSDDLLEEGYFRDKEKNFEEEMDAVYGPWDYFKGNEKFDERLVIPKMNKKSSINDLSLMGHLKRQLSGNHIPINAILFRKSVLEELGGFNTALKINQDVDLMFRFLTSGYNLKKILGPRALIRDHEGERVGKISSEKKLYEILELRKEMIQVLKTKGMWNANIAKLIGKFCFTYWTRYRRTQSEISSEFLELSLELYPDYEPPGDFLHQILVKTIGSVNTIKFKQIIGR
jgi:glycosyltransferase involved in cell wall biosynthesis